jgi:cyclomaltodextrinase / maltogenic alpha-amylase / neopullulanase
MTSGPALIWHTYPLGLLGADQTGADRTCHATLRELAGWLPHIVSLGADTLLLGPIFQSLSHGYDTVDHRLIDERLGADADFDFFLRAADEAGVGVVLDGAFAYVSRKFWGSWLNRDAEGEPVPWRVDSLITPDYAAPGYQSYVADVMTAWLDRGIRGWRLDSAWSVPASFWRRVLARVRRTHPDAWLLGQVFDDDLPPVINAATYSSATEYALMHGVRQWLGGGPAEGIAATLRLHRANSGRNPVHTFLGNHDFARLADTIDPSLLPTAFGVLMTLPGIPALYYGDEFGVTSGWAQGGSDALLRPAMSPDAAGRTDLLAAVQELGAFRRANPWLTYGVLDEIESDQGTLAYRVSGDGRSIRVTVDLRDAQKLRITQ